MAITSFSYNISPATRALVIGLGRSGFAAVRLLKKMGVEVVATDSSSREMMNDEVLSWLEENQIELHCGALTDALLHGINLVVPSPGVSLDQPVIAKARAEGIGIAGELALAASLYDRPVIAITGTNGKSTVTELVGEMLVASGYDPFVGGNLGTPLSEHMLTPKQTDLAILEVSSFQLDTAPYFRPEIAVLLNISPDHLDRYASYQGYVASKFSIFKDQQQNDRAVINIDDTEIRDNRAKYSVPGKVSFFGTNISAEDSRASVNGSEVTLSLPGSEVEEKYDLSGSFLALAPNVHNAAAAILVARLYGCECKGVEKALRDFKPLGHRLSLVAEVSGVKYFDDSKATNIGAVSAALSGFDTPVILIAGGRDKGGDYQLLRDQIGEKVKALILIGEARDMMAQALYDVTEIVLAESMADAVHKASQLAERGDNVLLSPACASFDMFDSYSHRGNVFREAVDSIMNNMEV